MGVPGSINNLLGAAPASYKIERSLRFNSSDSAYCSRVFSSAGNRKTWTWAGWVKRSQIGVAQEIFGAGVPGLVDDGLALEANGTLTTYTYSGSLTSKYTTTQVLRDFSAWYHIVWTWDSTNATAADRSRLYINGSRVTAFSISTAPSPSVDSGINNAVGHNIGREYNDGSGYFSGYLADIYFIDGQALDPASFTEVSATTGQLIPKKYTGTFTGNSFWLQFADNSAATATTLGKDSSGLGNNWTPNNLSVTAGAGNDSLTDTPTSYGTDTGAGGEVRGNYATLNPLKLGSSLSLANGNLDVSASGSSITSQAFSTIAVNSGLWYFEVTVSTNTNANATIGVATPQASQATYAGQDANSWGFSPWSGSYYLYINGVQTNPSAPGLTQTGTFGFAFDASSGKFWATDQAGTWLASGNPATGANPLISSITTTNGLLASVGHYSPGSQTTAQTVNFGQRQWAYAAPLGFEALVDTNIPVVIAKPSSVFNAITYTGTGANATIPNVNTVPTSIDFTPDLVWIKGRSGATDHALYDSVRDVQKDLVSNSTAAETTQSTGLTAFGTNNFNIGTLAKLNTSSSTYVGWCWDAGSSTVTNTQGSITSSVRANASAGFSIVTYSGNSTAGATVGHGLNVAPSLIIVKSRTATAGYLNWGVYHASLGNTKVLYLNTTGAESADSNEWNNTSPTSTVFSLGFTTGNGHNVSGQNYVAYCFAPVSGYSAMGSWVGNGVSGDGPYVHLGFRPRFILWKKSSSSSYAQSWTISDSARLGYNSSNRKLYPSFAFSENTDDNVIDLLSNGFKIRTSDTQYDNENGATYIYAAFAENPFQYARAR